MLVGHVGNPEPRGGSDLERILNELSRSGSSSEERGIGHATCCSPARVPAPSDGEVNTSCDAINQNGHA